MLTFLAVFLIQNSQNRDGAAIQAKLDEILRAGKNARSEFVGLEHLTDDEIARIKAALEREVHQVSDVDVDEAALTVDELFRQCRNPAIGAKMEGASVGRNAAL